MKEVENLRDELRDMERDLHRIQMQWQDTRAKKSEMVNKLNGLIVVEEELEHLAEEKHQIDLEEKVDSLIRYLSDIT